MPPERLPGAPRERWGQPLIIEDLLDVAHTPSGIRYEDNLVGRHGLLLDPQVVARTARGLSPREAVEDLLSNLALYGGRAGMTRPQVEAVAVLLNADFPYGRAGWRPTNEWSARRKEAARLLGAYGADWWKGVPRGRDRTRRCSGETDLYELFVRALRHVEAPASTTQGLHATPPAGDWQAATHADLLGTWAGVTSSEWLLKDREADARGTASCYMVMTRGRDGLAVHWYYRHGVSIGVQASWVPVGGRRRLVCVYEAYSYPCDDDTGGRAPSHRGTCLLDAGEGVIAGPYFNDRRTHGLLRFDRQVERPVTSFEDGAAVFL